MCGVSGCDGDDAECSAERSDDCREERPFCLAEEGRCVECLDDGGCSDEGRCLDWTCFPPAAPDFSLVDMNPSSSTYEQTFSLSEHFGEVVFVYFAALG